MQECIIINKSNLDVIGTALEEYWSFGGQKDHMINDINEARLMVKKIKEQIEKVNEVKICWG